MERTPERTRVTTARTAPPATADADRERIERRAQLGRLRRFRFERALGQGGMATVYLAADRERGDAPVAVKVLAPRLQDEPLAVARFRRELRTLMALRHRHIVTIVDGDAEADNGPCWLACRYLDGGTLRELLGRTGPLPAMAALPITAAILEAQAHAHAAGVVHRDLKPQNILLGSDGSLCVADFGLASAIGDVPLTSAGTRFGTPAYMSPEQAMGEAVDNRSDLFSTGAILHELLTGRSPFVRGSPLETMRAVAAGHATPLPPVVVVPDAVRTLHDAVLAVDRQARPPDAEAALRILRPLLAHCPPIDDVIHRLLAEPRAFADAAAGSDETAAGSDDTAAADANVGDALLAGPTSDIELQAAGFDDDPVIPAPRPPPRATPTPTLPLPPSTTPPPLTPIATPAPLPSAVASRPRDEWWRTATLGFSVVLAVGLVVLVVLWLRR
jgi:serine/threonine-protein kinase